MFENESVSLLVLYIIIVNLLLLIVLGVFFDGAAFPYGKIDGARYWIVNNAGTREVSESWFWLTYWQGLSACLGIGLLIGLVAIWDLARNSWAGALKEVISRITIVIAMSLLLFVSVLNALEIAQIQRRLKGCFWP